MLPVGSGVWGLLITKSCQHFTSIENEIRRSVYSQLLPCVIYCSERINTPQISARKARSRYLAFVGTVYVHLLPPVYWSLVWASDLAIYLPEEIYLLRLAFCLCSNLFGGFLPKLRLSTVHWLVFSLFYLLPLSPVCPPRVFIVVGPVDKI